MGVRHLTKLMGVKLLVTMMREIQNTNWEMEETNREKATRAFLEKEFRPVRLRVKMKLFSF